MLSHEVQLDLRREQVRQGDKQPRQVEFTRKRVVSRQERQAEEEVQLAQGLMQVRQVLVGVSG